MTNATATPAATAAATARSRNDLQDSRAPAATPPPRHCRHPTGLEIVRVKFQDLEDLVLPLLLRLLVGHPTGKGGAVATAAAATAGEPAAATATPTAAAATAAAAAAA